MNKTKYCKSCDTEKPAEDFYKYKDRSGTVRLHTQCKICHRKTTARWKDENKERQLEYQRRAKARNPRKKKLYDKERYLNHKDQLVIERVEEHMNHALNGTIDISRAVAFKKQFFQSKISELRTVV